MKDARSFKRIISMYHAAELNIVTIKFPLGRLVCISVMKCHKSSMITATCSLKSPSTRFTTIIKFLLSRTSSTITIAVSTATWGRLRERKGLMKAIGLSKSLASMGRESLTFPADLKLTWTKAHLSVSRGGRGLLRVALFWAVPMFSL